MNMTQFLQTIFFWWQHVQVHPYSVDCCIVVLPLPVSCWLWVLCDVVWSMLTVAEMLKYFNIDFNCTYVLALYISAFLLDVYIYK